MASREALYIISVAARLVDMHPSTLRKYERVGFLVPSRMGGKLRLYSSEDIRRLQQIKWLVEDRGVNIAGVDMALDLTELLHEVRSLLGSLDEAGRREWALAEVLRRVDEMLEMVGADPTEPSQDYQRGGQAASERGFTHRHPNTTW
jgi:MerR family transcriptional regulator/heat shock protein HspR